jgi:hypothetical protein
LANVELRAEPLGFMNSRARSSKRYKKATGS